MRRGAAVLAILAALAVAAASQSRSAPLRTSCSSASVEALVGGDSKCLHAGEFCSAAHQADYRRYGFSCVAGRLRTGVAAPAEPVARGRTVMLAARSRSRACRRGPLPDRRCSPGAYVSGLTAAVICAPGFRTGAIRNVPQSEKFAVELEYGMPPAHYGRTIEIDHIVPLELGGSNDIANLFPESGYRLKDRLENRLHALVCGGSVTLSAARRAIAANWEREYQAIFGLAP